MEHGAQEKQSSPAFTQATRSRMVLLGVLLFLSVAALYAPACTNGFVYDDKILVSDQKGLESLSQALGAFVRPSWYHLAYYRPFSHALFLSELAVFGPDPFWFHLISAILAGLCGMAVFYLFCYPGFGMRPFWAFWAALLAGIHPLASESVYLVLAAHENLLMAALGALSTGLFLRGRRWASLAVFGLALLSREAAVVIPGFFVLADLLGVSANPPRLRREWVARHAPFWALLALYLFVRRVMIGPHETIFSVLQAPSGPIFSLLYALQTMAAPFVQTVYEPDLRSWFSPLRMVFGLGLAGYGFLAFRKLERPARKTALFFAGWFFLALLPTANILAQDAHFSERYVFFALIGAMGFVGVTASRLVAAKWKKTAFLLSLAVLAAAGLVTAHRGVYFKDDLAFFRQWTQTSPFSALPKNHLGAALLERGRFEQARQVLGEGLAVSRDSFTAAMIHANLGSLYVLQKMPETAIQHYESALALNPAMLGLHFNMAQMYWVLGQCGQARSQLEELIRKNPQSLLARQWLDKPCP